MQIVLLLLSVVGYGRARSV